ncbi:MAG: hypothetical protein COA65_06945 [Rhodospirillaceae bacterium]|nr:MAG: hypothetical protein COA65_06945 [Rhodospirillaceae bacterium]
MEIKLSEILMIVAILLAPVVAVQVQKWLEKSREDRARKLWIFKALMATRAAAVSPEHVQALNMIDLEFRKTRYRLVAAAWKMYLDHLSSYPKDDEKQQPVWDGRRVDLLTSLLLAMGRALGYEFDEVHVKRGVYAPVAQGRLEDENTRIRRGLLDLLYGKTELKMNVTSFPVSEQALAEQEAIRVVLQQLLDGKRALPVSVSKKDDAGDAQ